MDNTSSPKSVTLPEVSGIFNHSLEINERRDGFRKGFDDGEGYVP